VPSRPAVPFPVIRPRPGHRTASGPDPGRFGAPAAPDPSRPERGPVRFALDPPGDRLDRSDQWSPGGHL